MPCISIWRWSKTDQRWIAHPLDWMPAQINDGVLTAHGNWPQAPNRHDSDWAPEAVCGLKTLHDDLQSHGLERPRAPSSIFSCPRVRFSCLL